MQVWSKSVGVDSGPKVVANIRDLPAKVCLILVVRFLAVLASAVQVVCMDADALETAVAALKHHLEEAIFFLHLGAAWHRPSTRQLWH